MRIGIGTYAMPEVAISDALPRLAEIGYEAVEICAAERWPTAPHKLSPADRNRLRDLIAASGIAFSGMLLFVNLLASAGEELERQLTMFRDACALARDLAPAAPPPLASPIGSSDNAWEEALPLVMERVALFGETVLGIAHPSHVLTIKGDHDLRPFAFLLRTMLACDGALSRDEMIVGPFSAGSDRDADAVKRFELRCELSSRLRNLRCDLLDHKTAAVSREKIGKRSTRRLCRK